MAKGMFSQGVCLLTNGRVSIAELRSALQGHDFEIVKEMAEGEHWCFGGASLVIPFLPEWNGYASVDLANRPWPDTMGDPKLDPMTFGAWSMGHFGPLAFPGALERARQHSWAWEEGRTLPESHRGFIRIRISYVFGADGDAPVLPEAYDPLAEMNFISRVVIALLKVPGVICYFNPNGEVLRDGEGFREVWDECRRQRNIPLPLWMNVRFYNLSETLGFMDTVGNGQLDISDVEAIFPLADFEPGQVDYYLRNVTHYLLDAGKEIRAGEAIDGPDESNLSWTVDVHKEGLIEPPRQVLRLYPKAARKAVREVLAAVGRHRA